MTLTTYGTKIDVRDIAPRDRHPMIFSTFRSLGGGESMELINDHDPRPLYYQFQAEMPGQFTWEYLQNGPEVWRVRIAKELNADSSSKASAGSGCCGGACGCA